MDLIEMARQACKEAHEAGVSWAELADHSGVSRSTLWRFLNAKHRPNVASLQDIWDSADVLKRSRDELRDLRRREAAARLGMSWDEGSGY